MAQAKQTVLDDLRRLQRAKSLPRPGAAPLGPEMIEFFQKSVAKRQGKMAKLGEWWGKLVPETLSDHCALESYTRGTLVVVVDSASHLYEIKQLLLSGIQQQLILACKSAGLRKINLKRGRWYDENDAADRRVRFGSNR